MADDAENAAPVNQRRSFTREFKLNAVGHYYHHGKRYPEYSTTFQCRS